ncbi:MAG: hypothetical protein JKY09_05295 [Crocinitomicaceae bacterium]|nr:hypothetical protein [Crocinitomicaceae bacterium]
MKNKFLLIVGIILGIISAYPVLGWIYIYNTYSEVSHLEKQSYFLNTILFGAKKSDIGYINLLIIFFSLLSVFIFSILLHRLNKVESKKHFVIYLMLLIVFSLFTFLNIWSAL